MKWHIYHSLTPPLNFVIVLQSRGGGAWGHCAPYSYASDSGAARNYCQRGSEATERGEGVGGGFPPYHGREIFENSCMKTAFSCTLNAINRGSLCSGIDQIPHLFFLLLLNVCLFLFFSFVFLFSPSFFSFSFFLLFFYSPINRGGGAWPLVPPLATPVFVTCGSRTCNQTHFRSHPISI